MIQYLEGLDIHMKVYPLFYMYNVQLLYKTTQYWL